VPPSLSYSDAVISLFLVKSGINSIDTHVYGYVTGGMTLTMKFVPGKYIICTGVYCLTGDIRV
jgi:hypothetical protein